MKTTYKYPLQITDQQTVTMPAGAQILHVGLGPHGDVCLWALVDSGKPTELRHIVVTGTGHPVPDGVTYLGSVTSGIFVWHVWEAPS